MRSACLAFALLLGCAGENPDFAPSFAASDVDAGSPADLTVAPVTDRARPLDLAPSCAASLAFAGGRDFEFRFRVTTAARDLSTILYQRASCDARGDFLDVRLALSGVLLVYTGHVGEAFSMSHTTIAVNDGKPHEIVITRSGPTVTSTTDGQPSGSGPAASTIDDLAPLGTAKGNPCENGGGLSPLVGVVDRVCLVMR